MVDRLDAIAEDTYIAVGIALTRWEVMEASLANLYALFRGLPFEKRAVVDFGRRYPTTLRRVAGLSQSAMRYFVRWPNQEREGQFKKLLASVEARSRDRHRIAHGLVDWVYFARCDGAVISGFALVAPTYAERRLQMTANDAWDSTVITQASNLFISVDRDIMAFTNLLIADHV